MRLSEVHSCCAHSLHPTSTNGHTLNSLLRCESCSASIIEERKHPFFLTPRWTRDQVSSEVYSELKGIPPSKIRMSSLTPQHTTHLTLTHRTLTLPSFTMQARCSAHWNSQTLTDQKKKNTNCRHTPSDSRTQQIKHSLLFYFVLPFTTCGPSPSSPIRIRTCARNSKQHQNEGDAQPIVDKRGSTNDLTLFHPQRS